MSTNTEVNHNSYESLIANLRELDRTEDWHYAHTILSQTSPISKKLVLHVNPMRYRDSWYEVHKDGKPLKDPSNGNIMFSDIHTAVDVYSSI